MFKLKEQDLQKFKEYKVLHEGLLKAEAAGDIENHTNAFIPIARQYKVAYNVAQAIVGENVDFKNPTHNHFLGLALAAQQNPRTWGQLPLDNQLALLHVISAKYDIENRNARLEKAFLGFSSGLSYVGSIFNTPAQPLLFASGMLFDYLANGVQFNEGITAETLKYLSPNFFTSQNLIKLLDYPLAPDAMRLVQQKAIQLNISLPEKHYSTPTASARNFNKQKPTLPNYHANPNPLSNSLIQQRLHEIRNSQQDNNIKIAKTMGLIQDLHKDMLNQRVEMKKQQVQAQTLANFEGIKAGFGLIQQIGSNTGSKGLQMFGTAGIAVTQGMLGFAQLTGTMGMTAVTGLSMITPVTAIVGGVLTLASLFSRGKNKEAKALQKQFRALSSQLSKIHSDLYKGFNILDKNMQKGFEIINTNLYQGFKSLNENMQRGFDTTNENIYNGFKIIDNNLSSGFNVVTKHMQDGFEEIIKNQGLILNLMQEGFQAIDFKLYNQAVALHNMDEKLQQILAQLQQLGIKYDERDRVRLHHLIERFNTEENSVNALSKILQQISYQLSISATSFKAFTGQSNNLTGWFYLQKLDGLFKRSEFQQFNINLKDVVNLHWAEFAFESYIQMIPYVLQTSYCSNPTIKNINVQVLEAIRKTTKATAEFIQTISSKAFLEKFFSFHQDKINGIKKSADDILVHFKSFTKTWMQKYSRDIVAQNQQRGISDFNFILQSININSRAMLSQLSDNSFQLLEEKIKEYNSCIELFKFQSNILFSILDLDTKIFKTIRLKLEKLIQVEPSYYFSKGISEAKEDYSVPHKPTYHYLNMNTDSKFIGCEISTQEIKLIQDSIEHSSAIAEYLELFSIFSANSLISNDNLSNSFLHEPTSISGFPLENNNGNQSDENSLHSYSFLKQDVNDKQQPIISNFNNGDNLMHQMQHPEMIKNIIELLKPVFKVAKEVEGKSIVYVVGITGDGKSTLLNYLQGSDYEKFISENDGEKKLRFIEGSEPEVCSGQVKIDTFLKRNSFQIALGLHNLT